MNTVYMCSRDLLWGLNFCVLAQKTLAQYFTHEVCVVKDGIWISVEWKINGQTFFCTQLQ